MCPTLEAEGVKVLKNNMNLEPSILTLFRLHVCDISVVFHTWQLPASHMVPPFNYHIFSQISNSWSPLSHLL